VANSYRQDTHWHPSHSPWLIAISVMLATFMEVLDTSVANVSLPHIAGSLAATSEEATWVLTSYLVANAIILPATNWLGGLFGRKRFLIACILIFTLASALCGAANSMGFLIFARILQGAGGGALQPISQAVLLESFPPARRGVAMAVFAMGVIVAPIVGPTLGGWITENYSWRWIFYINLPVGVMAMWMASLFVEDPPYLKKVDARNIDAIGFGFMAIWLATLQYILDKGQEEDWFSSKTITVCAVISFCSFFAFLIRELRTTYPIVDLRILKNRNFAVGVGLMTVLGAVLYGTTALLPLFMQTLLGYSSFDAGMAMSPRGICAFLATIVVGRIVGKVSNRLMMITGFLILGVSTLMLSRVNLQIGKPDIILPVMINGLAMSFIFVPLTSATMGLLRQDQMGNASGIFNLMRNIGGSIGIAAMTTLLARSTQSNQAALAHHFSPYNPVFQHHLAAVQSALTPHDGSWLAARHATAILYGTLQQQSALLGYIGNFLTFGIICLACCPLVLLFKRTSRSKGNVAVH